MQMPVRTRLTLVFATLIAAVLLAASVLFYREFSAQLDQPINDRLQSVALELTADLASGENKILADFGEADTEGLFAQVLDENGSVREVGGDIAEIPVAHENSRVQLSPVLFERNVAAALGAHPKQARLSMIAAPGNKMVLVGAYLQDRNHALRQLARLLWIGVPLLSIAGSSIAWFLAGAALRPVEELRRRAALISESDLTKRLPVPETADEIMTLATTLNSMLARLEQAFERERRFVDDASHELRTPLGNLKIELDLARRRSRTKKELAAALASAAEESERLNLIADNLLVLARSDRGNLTLKKTRVTAHALIHTLLQQFQARAKSRAVTFECAIDPHLLADVDVFRVQQALGNLISNGLAHAPRGGTIRVDAKINEGSELAITVSDTGPGFLSSFIEKAFDPFTRAETGRSRQSGGAGLGLAIVKGVVIAHGGSVEAANSPIGGAVVTMKFPQ